MATAKISDIFVSLQGEGKYLGQEQCFVRFYGCNLECVFCDTKLDKHKDYNIDEVCQEIKALICGKGIHYVSLTGGEPLLQSEFLLGLLPRLKQIGLINYLETNGLLYNEMFDLIDYIDIIAMDIKLPSSAKTGPNWQEHEKFIAAAKGKDLFVKAVICQETESSDVQRAVEIIAKSDPGITFILQPNSEQLGKNTINKLQEFKKYSKEYLRDVRIIPQLHKIAGIK